jgi:NADPH:quinone reductase-like Zn-dependent oxidoreductase
MKAAIYRRYGPPEAVIQIEDIDKPLPKDNEVLIKVRTASVNPLDCVVLGRPYIARIMFGLRKPRDIRLGVDVAGQVEAVGRTVTRFKPGEAVFGSCRGAFAEYACTSESKVVSKPDKLTFEQAASAPVAGLTALQGLRDKRQVQPGQKVLINGAAGGVGTFAVQIAKSFGAEVTGVCSTKNVDLVRSIGADQVIDYTQENFTESRPRYDLFFDLVGNHSLAACASVLNPNGIYIMAGVLGAPDGRWIGPLAPLLKTLVWSPFASQKMVVFLAKIRSEDLTLVRELMVAGKVTPVIETRYRLREVPQAVRYLGQKHARGKVVINLESNNTD